MKKKFKDKETFPINYKGKTYNTTIRRELTDEEFKQIKEQYYEKPYFPVVRDQLIKVSKGGVKINHITNYYFKHLMAKVILSYNNWCIADAFEYKPLLEFFAGKVYASQNFYHPEICGYAPAIECAFRLCGFGTCSKPSQFPLKTIDMIIDKYNTNGNYYDFACGWGVRLLSSLTHNINYFGTDPNYELVDELNQLTKDYKEAVENSSKVDIRVIGSEEFVPEWEGKIGLAFSSPPYFDLEDYQVGKQSYTPGMEYTDWLENYARPTTKNIYRYLTDDGYFCINLKNTYVQKVKFDWHKIALEEGFELVGTEMLRNIHRCHGHSEWTEDELREQKYDMINNDEQILVYKKKL